MLNTSSILPDLIEQVFSRLKNKPNKNFEDRDWLELKSLFGDLLDKSLQLLDTQRIILYQSQNKIGQILEIVGYGGKVHKLFPDINYCSCADFKLNVIQYQIQYTCKHVLAVKLAHLLGKVENQTLTTDQFNFLMQQLAT